MNLTAAKILSQVALIRESAAVFLLDKAYLARRLDDEFVNGESRPTFADLVEFNCRLITRSGSENMNVAAQARQVQQSTFTGLYRMQIPYDLEVSEGDHIFHDDKVTGERTESEVLYAPSKHELTGAVLIQLKVIK